VSGSRVQGLGSSLGLGVLKKGAMAVERPPAARGSKAGVWVVRVAGDDGELRPWHYIYVYSIESRHPAAHGIAGAGRKPCERDPLRAVHLSRHKRPGGLVSKH